MSGTRPSRAYFDRVGGTRQLRLSAAPDLAALAWLDEPYWMATSAPVHQLRCDPVLLARLAEGKQERLQSHRLRMAQHWLFHVLKHLDAVTQRRESLCLGDLNTGHDEGAQLLATARRILQNLGLPQADQLTLAQVRNRQAILAQTDCNGDGVIPPERIQDPALRAFAQDVMLVEGAAQDLSGAPGVGLEQLASFLDHARSLLDWLDTPQQDEDGTLFPLGEQTALAHRLVQQLAEPMQRYFDLCKLRQLNRLLGRETKQPFGEAELFTNVEKLRDYMTLAPLAPPRDDGPVLALDPEAHNPAYADALARLEQTVLAPLLGERVRDGLMHEAHWREARAAFARYEAWLAQKSGGEVEQLGPEKLRGYLTGDLPANLRARMERDLDAAPELSSIRDLEYLILLQRWFLDLCNNFVSFPDLYNPNRRAMFEVGSLVMDGRVFHFSMRVHDPAAHCVLAARGGAFLLYCELTGVEGAQPFHIVTPVTSGAAGNLSVEKRGVLFDRDGRQWDARVVRMVEHPISLTEALMAPFKRVGALVSSAVERFSAGAEKQLEAQVSKTADSLQQDIGTGMAVPAQAPPAGAPLQALQPTQQAPAAGSQAGANWVRDMVLSFSVAFAALGSSLTYIVKTFSEEPKWHYALVAVIIGLLVILLPTALIAYLKLRGRDLSYILEASGWAVNARMRLTRRLCKTLSPRPRRPTGPPGGDGT